ncbi:hypothetical protein RV09_GL001129 [Enterococcus moraviensis]|nr:hypothetical protein RV09_GL001129 [Enterococcus moraviensis]
MKKVLSITVSMVYSPYRLNKTNIILGSSLSMSLSSESKKDF